MSNRSLTWVATTCITISTLVAVTLWAQLGVPASRAVAAQGELQEQYSLIDTWDGSQGQGAPGSVLYPAGLDVTARSVFLVDQGNHRIQEFSQAGEFLQAWGQLGSELGDLRYPQDVVVEGSKIYVTDRGNARVVVYDLQGVALEAWSAPGMDSPWGIAAKGNRVYVTVPESGEVVVLESGNVVNRWTGLEEPRGIEVGPDGRVYVAEEAASAVGFYSAQGAVEGKLVSQLVPTDVALDEGGDLYLQSEGAILWYKAGTKFSKLAMYFVPFQGIAVTSRHGIYGTVASDALQFHGVLKYPWNPPEGKPSGRWELLAYPPGRFNGPIAAHAGPNGEIWLLDSWPRVQALDDGGRPVTQYALPAQHVYESAARRAVDVLSMPNGEVIAGEPMFIHRLMPDGALSGTLRLSEGSSRFWLTALDRPTSDSYAMVLDSALMNVRSYGVTSTLRLDSSWPLEGVNSTAKWELYWDLAVARGAAPGRGDRSYAVNRSARRIEIYDGQTLSTTWDVEGIPSRAALGPDGNLFVLTAGGIVWKYALDGQPIAGWDAGAFSAGGSLVSDLTVGADGRVYTSDAVADTVRVWQLDPSATPEPPPAGGTACRLRGDKRADPSAVRIGQTTQVELSVGGECPNAAPRADIVLAIDRSYSMNQDNKITTTVQAALSFIGAVDLTKDRIGIVTFNNSARADQTLTGDRVLLETALRNITAVGGTDIADAIRVSAEEIVGERHRPDALPVIILLTDGIDRDPDAVLIAAFEAKAQGATIFTIGFGEVDPMVMVYSASTPEHHYYAPDPSKLAEIYAEIARRLLASVLATEMSVVDEVPDNMTYVPGSANLGASWDPSVRTLTWQLTDVPFSGMTLSYVLEPQNLGRHPTNVEASAAFTDGLDQEGSLRFPIPYVDVLAKDPTPTPTSTPFPTVTPTPRPPKPIYLPITVNQKCEDLQFHAELVLAMDTSGSMELPSTEGGESKIVAAVVAARAFVERLDLPNDRAAIVSFDSESRLEQRLTGDRQALMDALDGLETATGTRIDLGLETALEELTSERARMEHNRVIVLLTDGKNSVPNDQVLEVAERCREARILIFTIGLGTADDVDYDLLRQVASDPDYFFIAPTTDDLDKIYEEIAFTLECVNLTWP